MEGAGDQLRREARDVQPGADELTDIKSGMAKGWSGEASDAASAHLTRRTGEIEAFSEVLHSAGGALITAAEGFAKAQAALRAALGTAAARGMAVNADGGVTPPAAPDAPGALAGEELARWQQQSDVTAQADAGTAALLAGQIADALNAAAAADNAGKTALAALSLPALSPAPKPIQMGLVGGQWGTVGPPSPPLVVPVVQDIKTPSTNQDKPDEVDKHGTLYDVVGGIGSGAWKAGPGLLGDLVGIIPGRHAQAVDDRIDKTQQDLTTWYDADTSGAAYRTADLGTQGVGLVVTGGAAAIKGIPLAVRTAPKVLAPVKSAIQSGRSAIDRMVNGLRTRNLEPVKAVQDVGLSTRGLRPRPGTRVRPQGVPTNWRIKGADGAGGTRYLDPNNSGHSVRVMQGDPESIYPNSRSPYIRLQRHGQPLDVLGNQLSTAKTSAAHIPLKDWITLPGVFG